MSPLPLATAEIADTLDLHVNTVRPHLERMREVGLLEVDSDARGRRRPSAAPLLAGRRRPVARARAAVVPVLARMLLRLAAASGPAPRRPRGRPRPGPGRRPDAGRGHAAASMR